MHPSVCGEVGRSLTTILLPPQFSNVIHFTSWSCLPSWLSYLKIKGKYNPVSSQFLSPLAFLTPSDSPQLSLIPVPWQCQLSIKNILWRDCFNTGFYQANTLILCIKKWNLSNLFYVNKTLMLKIDIYSLKITASPLCIYFFNFLWKIY